MDYTQIITTGLTALVPATISYFAARHHGKIDLKKLDNSNKSEIEKLMKQHEINLEALKETHKMEMEAKEKEQEYTLQIMQKEFDLKISERQQATTNNVMGEIFGSVIKDLLDDPDNTMDKLQKLQGFGDRFNK